LRQLICFLISFVIRWLLSLRYRIKIRGLEHLKDVKGPALILPNHPAFIDPVILLALLYPHLRLRPLVYEANFRSPFFRPFGLLLRAISMPELEQFSHKRGLRVKEAIGEVIAGLRQGENHILWPAGWLRRDGLERVGGARAVGDVLTDVPNAEVILIRTQGLWGSMFSCAPTGSRPDFARCLGLGFLLLLGNFWFFAPRRPISITIEAMPRSALPALRRRTLNPWLEDWYNADGPEAPTFVPYHFWFGPRTIQFTAVPDRIRPDRRLAAPPVKAPVAELSKG
jgi:long-chain-fatty-acid--[acyl-carrier-protein] ligase